MIQLCLLDQPGTLFRLTENACLLFYKVIEEVRTNEWHSDMGQHSVELVFPGLSIGLQPFDASQEDLLFSVAHQIVAGDQVDKLTLTDVDEFVAFDYLR